LLIALSCLFALSNQHSLCDACFFWEKCCTFREIVQCIADPTSSWNIWTICFWGNEVDKLVSDMDIACIFSVG
jgi:hypothetical protein